jgi:hypothetical protein
MVKGKILPCPRLWLIADSGAKKADFAEKLAWLFGFS